MAKLQRKLSQWEGCEPEVMATMSEVAIMYAFKDAKHDMIALHRENRELLDALQGIFRTLDPQIPGEPNSPLEIVRRAIQHATGETS